MTTPPSAHFDLIKAAIQRVAVAAADLQALVERGINDAAIPYWSHVIESVPEYDQVQDRLDAHALIYRIRDIKRILDDAEVALAHRSCKLTLAYLYDALEYQRLMNATPKPQEPETGGGAQ